MVFIKQHGAHRSGTNYLQSLLNLNFSNVKVLTNHLGWKHGSAKNFKKKVIGGKAKIISYLTEPIYNQLVQAVDNNEVWVTISIKEPYGWIDSMQRYMRRTFTPDQVKKHMERYNAVYWGWYRHFIEGNRKGIIVNYEDLLNDYRVPLRMIKKRCSLSKKSKTLKNVTHAVGPSTKQKDFKTYYLNKSYKSNLSKKTISVINKNIDEELLKVYNYGKVRNL